MSKVMKIEDCKHKEYKFPSDKKVRTRVLASLFTCKICNKLIKESTTIGDCLHSFCKKCIYKKVFEEKSRKCPVCNLEFTDPPAKVLRPDAMMRSLKVRLFGSHKRTPEQRAESKRIKFENMQASDDQVKKPQSTKNPVITCKDKTKEKVIVKPLEDERTSSQSTKKPPITNKDKGKAIVTDEGEPHDPRDSLQKGIVIRSPPWSPPPPVHKKQMISSKSEVKQPTKEIIPMDNKKVAVTTTTVSGSRKGTVIRSPPPPPPVHKNQMISSKSEAKQLMKEIIPMDNKNMAVTATTASGSRKGIIFRSLPPWSPPPPVPENQVIFSKSKGKQPISSIIPMDNEKMAVTTITASGSKSEEPKRRVRQKRDATTSNGTRISPQDVIDAGKYINPAKKTHYTWFNLAPSEEQNRKEPLRPLPGPNVNIKFDWKSHPTVSTLMKYIAMQLKLDSGEKVGIFMYGSLLSPEMKLGDVVNQWIEIVGSQRETTNIGTSAHYFCIKLTYA